MKSTVFNNNISSGHRFDYPKLSHEQEQLILASLFEQLLIFDKITISTDRLNFSLYFLLKHLGIDTVERLIDSGYIEFMIWSPMIVSGTGRQMEDGSIDESVIYGQTPLAAGTLSSEDLDPEKNIEYALSNLNIRRDIKRSLKKRIRGSYIVPDGMLFSTDSANIVVDAYLSNSLADVGLPFEKAPENLDINQRELLLNLGYKVLETAVLSKYNLKSYENYEHYAICKHNLANIGKAYNVSDNTSVLMQLENLPNLKELYLQEHLDFNNIFKLRHLSNAKYYRNWINSVGENSNAQEITKEYLNQIKGKGKFFETNAGKLVKNLGVFGVSTALGIAVTGAPGIGMGLGLGLLDTFWLDSILKGKNPSMFIENIREEVQKTSN
jgi:hypothetical protein